MTGTSLGFKHLVQGPGAPIIRFFEFVKIGAFDLDSTFSKRHLVISPKYNEVPASWTLYNVFSFTNVFWEKKIKLEFVMTYLVPVPHSNSIILKYKKITHTSHFTHTLIIWYTMKFFSYNNTVHNKDSRHSSSTMW